MTKLRPGPAANEESAGTPMKHGEAESRDAKLKGTKSSEAESEMGRIWRAPRRTVRVKAKSKALARTATCPCVRLVHVSSRERSGLQAQLSSGAPVLTQIRGRRPRAGETEQTQSMC
eukprot:6197585-Pleurochrysis_carterae.AAC.2